LGVLHSNLELRTGRKEKPMSTDTNKAVCRRHYEEVLTGKKLEVVDEIYGDQIKVGDGDYMPRDQFKGIVAMSITAFPDLVITVRDQIAEDDRVVSRWSGEGTHLGDFLGHHGTGKKVKIHAIHIHQVVNGRIVTLWEEIDMLGLSKQLGIEI
jgi:steroid delta-isomerase-like uncharacterized protein